MESTGGQKGRRRGRRPGDAAERRTRVVAALAELEASRVPFTMADLAERAGISRATLYRDAGLRDLVGARGDGPRARPVTQKAHCELAARADALAEERRALRRAVRAAQKRVREAEARIEELESAEARRAARGGIGGQAAEKMKADAYAQGFAAGARSGGRAGGGNAGLAVVAARLPGPALVNARRALARALHPDLFAKDPAAALLATELLKQINAVVGSER